LPSGQNVLWPGRRHETGPDSVGGLIEPRRRSSRNSAASRQNCRSVNKESLRNVLEEFRKGAGTAAAGEKDGQEAPGLVVPACALWRLPGS
jgi:hypothetical protein